MKTCVKCRKPKLTSEFGRDASRKDGLQSNCKACRREYQEANRDRIAEYLREYRDANRDKISELRREYEEANREKIAERRRGYREANREKIAARQREYNEAISTQAYERCRSENAASIWNATHRFQPWLAVEDLVASRSDLTAKEAAFMLGRSIYSVERRRHHLRNRADSTIKTEAGLA